MKIIIEFYGRLKDEFSQLPIEFEVNTEQENINIESIYLQLCDKFTNNPNTKIIKPILNDSFTDWHQSVSANDVIGFFPPAAGG